MIGKAIEVFRKSSNECAAQGTVIDETAEMLTVLTPKKEIRFVKNAILFRLLPAEEKYDGSLIRKLPHERLKTRI